jgi:hypothetical protein
MGARLVSPTVLQSLAILADPIHAAAQFIPIISNDPQTRIINFSRTPSWIAPRFNMTISNAQKKAFASIPYLQTVYRAGLVSLVRTRCLALHSDRQTYASVPDTAGRALDHLAAL